MKLIYVSGKYTDKTEKDIQRNIDLAEEAASKLFELGWSVITPHKNTSGFPKLKFEWINWLEVDFEMISRCDAIFMLKNWKESCGAKSEYVFAKWLGKEIYFEEWKYPKAEE